MTLFVVWLFFFLIPPVTNWLGLGLVLLTRGFAIFTVLLFLGLLASSILRFVRLACSFWVFIASLSLLFFSASLLARAACRSPSLFAASSSLCFLRAAALTAWHVTQYPCFCVRCPHVLQIGLWLSTQESQSRVMEFHGRELRQDRIHALYASMWLSPTSELT